VLYISAEVWVSSPAVDPSDSPRLPAARTSSVALAVVVTILLALNACGGDDGPTLTIYSGRNEELVGPLLERFTDETGIDIEVFYDGSTEVALKIDAEGDDTPADVFLSQAPGPLGFLDAEDRFAALPAAILDRVDPAFRAADGQWVGVSGRARVLTYSPDRTPEDALPGSVLDLTDPDYAGRVGIAPTNASFQDWVSALRVELGDEATSSFLEGLAANGAKTYSGNIAVVEAVERGEIDFGLVNHYYVLELRGQNPDLGVENHFFAPDDPGSLVLVSGVAILDTTDQPDEAQRFAEFLLEAASQEYLTEETREFPLAAGVEPADDLPAITEVATASVDLASLGEQFSSTRDLIIAAGFDA
jgi:iron(III) transport system substrate-binding protein